VSKENKLFVESSHHCCYGKRGHQTLEIEIFERKYSADGARTMTSKTIDADFQTVRSEHKSPTKPEQGQEKRDEINSDEKRET
jgi:hypothetical protein